MTRSMLAGPYATLKSENLVIREQGDQFVIFANVTRQDGSAGNSTEEVSKTGGALKYLEGALPLGLSRVVRRVNVKTIEILTFRNGLRIQDDYVVVSGDRKEMHITRRGAGASGTPFESIEVLERR